MISVVLSITFDKESARRELREIFAILIFISSFWEVVISWLQASNTEIMVLQGPAVNNKGSGISNMKSVGPNFGNVFGYYLNLKS